jgi:hypothetical protein
MNQGIYQQTRSSRDYDSKKQRWKNQKGKQESNK